METAKEKFNKVRLLLLKRQTKLQDKELKRAYEEILKCYDLLELVTGTKKTKKQRKQLKKQIKLLAKEKRALYQPLVEELS